MKTFEESINLNNGLYLSKLNYEYFINNIFNKEETTEDGQEYDTLTYIKNLKLWLNRVIPNKGINTTSYKFSSILKDHGRQYVNKFGIQSLQRDIRGFLCKDIYDDYDMINAHPTILNYINNTFLKKDKIETPYLLKYINNRKEIINKWKITKEQVLIIMNTEKEYKGTNQFLKGLDAEFKRLQKKIFSCNDEYFLKINRTKNKKGNLKGTFLNRVLCCIENDILNLVINIVGVKNVGSKIFDGLFIDKKFNDFNIIDKFDETTKEYGIKWTQKPHSEKIQIDPDMELPEYISNYTKIKNEFEETHFRIEQPLLFGVETIENGKKTYYLYNKADFMTLCEIYEFTDEKTDEEKSFFKQWNKDKIKRTYKRLVFDPSTTENLNGEYNTFNGFNFSNEGTPFNEGMEGVNLFLDHIKLLCNYEEEPTNYLINYIADIFQNPQVLPEVSCVLTGSKGVGKDLLIDYLEKIIDIEYITRTQKFNNLFGNFNSALKNKLIISINEVSGKDGYNLKEELKNFITEKTIIINEKGLKPYKLRNYSRLFMFCNNDNPIEVTEDNRRFFVVKTGEKQSPEYYNLLYKNLNDPSILESIYLYFKNIDLTEFKIRQFPKTKKMQIMEEHNINPLYLYLFDKFENNKESSIFISSKKLFYSILSYFEDEGHPTTHITKKYIKNFLLNIKNSPIEAQRKTIKKETQRGFGINIPQLLQTIKPLAT